QFHRTPCWLTLDIALLLQMTAAAPTSTDGSGLNLLLVLGLKRLKPSLTLPNPKATVLPLLGQPHGGTGIRQGTGIPREAGSRQLHWDHQGASFRRNLQPLTM